MNKNRALGVLLFSVAGLIVWFSFWAILEGVSFPLSSELIYGAFAASIAASISSFFLSPKIYSLRNSHKSYGNAFGYGFVITLLSFLVGSVIFCLDFWEGDIDFLGFLGLILFAFIYSSFMMSPGLILGGLTGILLYHMSNKFDPQAT